MNEVWLILKTELAEFRNSIFRGGYKALLTPVLGIAVIIFFFGAVTTGAREIFELLQATFQSAPGLMHRVELNILSAASLSVFVLLLITGVKYIYDTLYDSDDIAFLLATPLKTSSVFTAKLIQSGWVNLQTVLVLGLPVWIAFGAANSAPPVFYLLTVISLLLGAILFQGLAAMLIMLIMKFIPSKKMKQVLLMLSLGVGLIFVFATQYASSMLSNGINTHLANDFLQKAGSWGLEKFSYLPHIWMIKIPLSTVNGFEYSTVSGLLPLTLAASIIFASAAALAQNTFLAGWASAGESETSGKPQARKLRNQFPGTFRGPFWGNLKKDTKLLLREPMLWYNFAVGAIVVGFLVYRYISNPSSMVESGTPGFITKTIPIFFVMIMSSSIGSQLGGTSISREGQSWWLIQASPMPPSSYYLAKLVYGFVPSVVFSFISTICIHFLTRMPSWPLYVSLPLETVMLLGFMSLVLLIDTCFPNFSIKFGTGRLGKTGEGKGKLTISSFIALGASFIMFATFAFPGYYEGIPIFKTLGYGEAQILSLLALGLETIGLAVVSYTLGVKRLASLFMSH